jgi:serine phosphatase RsbU (regulator of sigma subunit)
MASLRYSIRAFASQGHMPNVVLSKLNSLLDVHDDGHFATVLCAVVDVAERTVVFANAGHPNPLVLNGEHAAIVEAPIGVPIGVRRDVEYEIVTHAMPVGATLLMFTDGLFERRLESIDVGLERLRASASGANGSLGDLLTSIIDAQTAIGDGDDDTAILGVRWLI